MVATIVIPLEWLVPLGFLGLCLIASWSLFHVTGPRHHHDDD
jgi:hypothetical protein